jgi:DNA-binding transcriptional MerR regulator
MNISELGRRFSLSRATLLYYDRRGLLRPSTRRANGYRNYSETDEKRLEQIVLYRRAGLPLREIRTLLEKPATRVAGLLERQLHSLAEQIDVLRERQRLIVRLLGKGRLLERVQVMNRKTWVQLLRASGFTDVDLHRRNIPLVCRQPEEREARPRLDHGRGRGEGCGHEEDVSRFTPHPLM